MPSRPFSALLLAVAGLTACGPAPRAAAPTDTPAAMPQEGSGEARAEPPDCARPGDARVRVRGDSVGPFAVDARYRELTHCPSLDTDGHLPSSPASPSRDFAFGGVTVAAQTLDTVLAPAARPDAWEVYWREDAERPALSDGGLVPLTVGDLARRYGPVVIAVDWDDDPLCGGEDGCGTWAEACGAPGIRFMIAGDPPVRIRGRKGRARFDVANPPVDPEASLARLEIFPAAGSAPPDSLCDASR